MIGGDICAVLSVSLRLTPSTSLRAGITRIEKKVAPWSERRLRVELPGSGSKQTTWTQIMRLDDEFGIFEQPQSILNFRFIAKFDTARVAKGRRLILGPEEATVIKVRQRRYRNVAV
jgi:hypothetical protein